MKNQSQGQVRHLLGFLLGQRRKDTVGIACEATPSTGWTHSAASADGERRGTGGGLNRGINHSQAGTGHNRTSMMAHVCRFTAVCALALPAAIGTATGIAHASTTGATNSGPPTGSYSGYDSQNGNGMKFYVSADRKSLQDVVFPVVDLDCTPGNTGFGEDLVVASVAISPTGSFSTTATQAGVVSGRPAIFTYAFRGNFHGVAASGAERAAGTYAETVRYTDSTAHVCTSNSQWWYASLR